MFVLQGKVLLPDRPFKHPTTGVRYPANWLVLTSLAEKEAIGITVESDPVEPAPPAPTAEQLAAQEKQNAKNALLNSDTLAARKVEDLWGLLVSKGIIAEVDVPVPVAEWITDRKANRAKATTGEITYEQ
jgi:hypothetical protein